NWGRQTCKQRFEQDGCGLSIFRDCQDSKRQWAGTIDEDLRISMKPIFRDDLETPAVCQGVLDAESFDVGKSGSVSEIRYSAQLACTNVPGVASIGLESQLSSEFHRPYRREDAVQVARVDQAYRDSISEALLVPVGDEEELWVVYRGNAQSDGSEASISIHSVTEQFSNGLFRSSKQIIPMPNLQDIAIAPNKEHIWAVAGPELIRIRVDTKEQTKFNIVEGVDCSSSTNNIEVMGSTWVAVAADNETIFTASDYREGTLISYLMRQWRVTSSTAAPDCVSEIQLNEPLGRNTRLKKYELASLVETSTTMFVLSEDPFTFHRLFKLDFFHDGSEPEFTEVTDQNVFDFHVFADEGLIGVIASDMRVYQEMTFEGEFQRDTGSAFPWLRSPTSITYDEVGDRVFVVGYDFCEVTDRPENDPCMNPFGGDDQTIRVMAAGSINRSSRRTAPNKIVFRDFEKGTTLNFPARIEYSPVADQLLVFDTSQAYLYIVPTP
ncbi:MAG: hypothetical protein VYC39_05940, partial [Myxococcota bacterium]|nr:hypothetical protein [Myxococcota bacterium]